MKTCKKCTETKPLSEFYKNGYTHLKPGREKKYRSDCKVCCNLNTKKYLNANSDKIKKQRREAYRKDKTKAIESNLKRYYKLTLEEYEELFKAQNGQCKICETHQDEVDRRFDVDHNHETGRIRGLLCIKCNRGIGLLQDSIQILQTALNYLQEDQELSDKKPIG
jgi:hypothetical protein